MSNLTSFYEPFYKFERPLGLFFGPSRVQITPTSNSSQPKLDLHEDTEKNIITATLELPGIKKEDVQLIIQNNILTVSVENKISSEYEESGYIVRERHIGKLSRSLVLPLGVKDEDVKAGMADGVLRIEFPRSSSEQEPKKIVIV